MKTNINDQVVIFYQVVFIGNFRGFLSEGGAM